MKITKEVSGALKTRPWDTGRPADSLVKACAVVYPAGALVRVSDICRDAKTGRAGLLPINRSTWYKWLKAGRVPQGQRLGENTTAWPVEVVLSIGAPYSEAGAA